ncbi:hypothetical protein [Massilia sp. ST3]|uniref:hypothetical protein n=1 Tax=Massilia sp. ST3 TaxID=2824903 RepID=UPI001B8418F4|nr:hypothetical protein [Massilia sp. ST3]MBQ5945971.1 hypothetical protein [Massilia sp. ST3]
MNQQHDKRPRSGGWTLAALLGPLALAASSMANGGGQPAAPQQQSVLVSPGEESPDHRAHGAYYYSVVNMPMEEGASAYLNEKGQLAYSSFVFGDAGFFDGDRIYSLGSLGGGSTSVRGLNNRGVVVGDTLDASEPFGAQRAFTWTAARGMRALPGPLGASARAVNDRNQVAGAIPAAGITARAVRWDPDGRLRMLGPVPLSLSEAWTMNDAALAGGFADVADGSIHATVWDSAGRVTDLGTMGGLRGFTYHVNRWGAAAGVSDSAGKESELAFYWSPRSGRVPIGARNAGVRLVAALNDRGEVAGLTETAGGFLPYLWSRSRGLVLLPRGGAQTADLVDLNNRGEMVGALERRPGQGLRAVRWPGLANPLDLTTRVYRGPPGLVIHAATAINDAGVIAAHSNAGLVLLRPGTRGTDAPVLGPIAGLPGEAALGAELRLSLGFVDNSPTQSHTARVDWSDGCSSPLPLLREARGVGRIDFQHRFCEAGFHTVTVTIADSGGRHTQVRKEVFVSEPGMATLSGRGALAGTGGAGGAAGPASGPLRFTVWAPLGEQAAAAAQVRKAGPLLVFSGPVEFRADRVLAAARDGRTARLEGTGRLNGRPGHRFQLEATDAVEGRDSLRVRVTHTDASGREAVDYDSGAPAKAKAAIGPGAQGQAEVVEGQLVLSE